MADKTLTERLQPSLLDRLSDDAPDEKQESSDQRVIDIRRLRMIIQRDLSWLLNSGNNNTEIDAEAYPYVARSSLNYGIGEVSGSFSSIERAQLIRKMIQDAIETYEPRIAADTLQVRITGEGKREDVRLTFDISADMWAQPVPLELYLRSQFDLATGELHLERVS